MSLKTSATFVDLWHCFKSNSCRYSTRHLRLGNTSISSVSRTRQLTRRAYPNATPVILQHATISPPISWLDKYRQSSHSYPLETTEQQHKDGFIRILSARSYATATTAEEPGTSREQAILSAVPDPSKMAPDEEIEVLDKNEARFSITERAAEKLSHISASENDPKVSLRVAVESGGCHGYQYKLELTSDQALDDYRFVHPKHQNAAIVVDSVSLGLLKGSTLDYATELIGSSFRIIDNPQAKTAGCGCGISWEAKF